MKAFKNRKNIMLFILFSIESNFNGSSGSNRSQKPHSFAAPTSYSEMDGGGFEELPFQGEYLDLPPPYAPPDIQQQYPNNENLESDDTTDPIHPDLGELPDKSKKTGKNAQPKKKDNNKQQPNARKKNKPRKDGNNAQDAPIIQDQNFSFPDIPELNLSNTQRQISRSLSKNMIEDAPESIFFKLNGHKIELILSLVEKAYNDKNPSAIKKIVKDKRRDFFGPEADNLSIYFQEFSSSLSSIIQSKMQIVRLS